MPQLANGLVNVGEREVRASLRKPAGDAGRPAPRQLLERAHIEVAIVKEALELGHVPGEEAAVLADAVTAHRGIAFDDEEIEKLQGELFGLRERDRTVAH